MTSPELQIVMWDVAHGSAIYVRTPNGRSMLLDAGSSEDFSPALHLWQNWNVRATDALIISHGDADHVRDIANVRLFTPPAVLVENPAAPRNLIFPTDPPDSEPLKSYDEFRRAFFGPPAIQNRIDLPANWGGVSVATFWSIGPFTKLNNYSVVTVITFGNLVFVFPGDLERAGSQALANVAGFMAAARPASIPNAVRILVAAHHGHTQGVDEDFLRFFEPHLTLISGPWGDRHTALGTYYTYSDGYPVYSRSEDKSETRYVLTTKTNEFIRVVADGAFVFVSIP
ncbi:MAG: MBL fold metallo-hydrolase [Gemmatimonadales bacterium]|nr:MBL fold metallo-hydrolase [Gemmatimonadales bacterium]